MLYGPSGVGKSSLLRAGIAQTLRTQGIGTVVVHDTWTEDPTAGLNDAVREAAPALGPTAGLVDTVAAAARASGDVVLLLDQLEEYFLYHGPDGPLVETLGSLLRRPGLRVSVLAAVREDALAELDAFAGRLPEVFSNLIRLDPIGSAAAGEAILGPLDAYSTLTGERAGAEQALVQRLKSEVDQGLEAPFLQLTLARLWDASPGDLRLETLERLGGTATIVRRHVSGALDALPGGDRTLTAKCLRQLVTPSGSKVALPASDLAEYAGVSVDRMLPLLEHLARERILRATGDSRYEIFHDVLASPLTEWRQTQEVHDARANARRLAAISLTALIVVAAIAIFAIVQRSDARDQARHARAHAIAAQALAAPDPTQSLELGLTAARLSPDADAAAVLRSGLLAMRERRVFHLGGQILYTAFRGNTLITASSNGRVALYRGGQKARSLPRLGQLTTATATNDGLMFATGAADGTATIWDTQTGRPLRVVKTSAPVATLSFDKHELLIGSGAKLQVVHGTHGSIQTIRLHGAVVAAAIHGKRIAVATKLRGRVTTHLIGGKVLPEHGITVLAFSPNGRLLATGSTDKTARLWNASGRKLLHVLPQRGHILSLRFSSGGRTLISTSDDGTAAVWDTSTGERQLLLTGATGAAEASAFAPDGSEYAVGFADRYARLYSSIDGRVLAPLAGHTDAVTSVNFNVSGRLLVTGSADGTIRLWDANANDQFTATTQRISDAPSARVVSPDGTVAAVRKARVVQLIDVRTGDVLHTLTGHRSAVTDAEFSPNGRFLVTASIDHDARVWDVETGRLVHVLRGHFFPVYSASFSSDGQWIVTASQLTAGLWNASSGELVEYLRGAPAPLANAEFRGTTIVAVTRTGNFVAAACVVCRSIAGLESVARERLAAVGAR